MHIEGAEIWRSWVTSSDLPWQYWYGRLKELLYELLEILYFERTSDRNLLEIFLRIRGFTGSLGDFHGALKTRNDFQMCFRELREFQKFYRDSDGVSKGFCRSSEGCSVGPRDFLDWEQYGLFRRVPFHFQGIWRSLRVLHCHRGFCRYFWKIFKGLLGMLGGFERLQVHYKVFKGVFEGISRSFRGIHSHCEFRRFQ